MPHNMVLWEVNGDQGKTVIQRFSFSQDREERPLSRHSTQWKSDYLMRNGR